MIKNFIFQWYAKLKKIKNIFFCVFKRFWIFDHYTIFNFLIFKFIFLIIIFYVPFILFVWVHYAIFGFYCGFFYLYLLQRDQWNIHLTPYPLLTYLSYFLFLFSLIFLIEFFFIWLFYVWCLISYHSFSFMAMLKTMWLPFIIAFLFSSFLSFFCLLKLNDMNKFLLDWFLVIMLLIISFIVTFFIYHRIFDLLKLNLFHRRKFVFVLVYAIFEYFTYVGVLFHLKIYYLITFLIGVIYLMLYFLMAAINLIKFYNNNKDKKEKKNND